jgi:uncharacterized protein YbjQ (UPF0145 family)
VQEVSVPSDIASRLDNQIPTVTTADISSLDFVVVKELTATSCFNNFITDASSSERDAMRQLKYKAAQYDADALLNTICTKEGTSLSKNCWTSVTCSGDAIRIKSQHLQQRRKEEIKKPLTVSLL